MKILKNKFQNFTARSNHDFSGQFTELLEFLDSLDVYYDHPKPNIDGKPLFAQPLKIEVDLDLIPREISPFFENFRLLHLNLDIFSRLFDHDFRHGNKGGSLITKGTHFHGLKSSVKMNELQ